MSTFDVAVVSSDERFRHEMARALDAAPADWKIALLRSPPETCDALVVGPDVSLEGGIRVDLSHPSGVIDQIRPQKKWRGTVVGVTAAGGGVGVTTVSLHLARALARSGHRTALMDLDLRWRSASFRMGLALNEEMTWGSADDLGPQQALPVAGGFRFLAAPHSEDQGFDAVAKVSETADLFDSLVLDLPAGRPASLALRTLCDRVVVVVPPTREGVDRARHLSNGFSVPPVFVLNRLGPGGDLTTAALSRELGCGHTIELPCTPALRDQEDDSSLLRAPWSRWVRRMAKLAASVQS
jgi:Mrp family chromosome partitioning ATPase